MQAFCRRRLLVCKTQPVAGSQSSAVQAFSSSQTVSVDACSVHAGVCGAGILSSQTIWCVRRTCPRRHLWCRHSCHRRLLGVKTHSPFTQASVVQAFSSSQTTGVKTHSPSHAGICGAGILVIADYRWCRRILRSRRRLWCRHSRHRRRTGREDAFSIHAGVCGAGILVIADYWCEDAFSIHAGVCGAGILVIADYWWCRHILRSRRRLWCRHPVIADYRRVDAVPPFTQASVVQASWSSQTIGV